jgi:3-dehydroquinate dehydratase
MQNSLTYKTITESDFENLLDIFQSKPDYIEIDLNLVKKYSLPINNLKDKPKKKKNLLIEMGKYKELPKLNLNLKESETKIVISYRSDKSTNFRNLRKIQKAMKGFNCDVMKFVVDPQNDSQNIDLVRLLVSKVESDKIEIQVHGKYFEFWNSNGEFFGNYNF